MSLANLDDLIAGLTKTQPRFFFKQNPATATAGRPATMWAKNGAPGPGSYDSTLAGVALVAPVDGQIPYEDAAGAEQAYLAGFGARTTSSIYGPIVLADRLWHNGGFTITSTSPQTVNSAAFPARDADGSTNGRGVLLALEVSATVGAATPTVTVSYTNSDGVSGRTGTLIDTQGLSGAVANTMFRIGLQAGDVGVRSVQSLTLSASWVSGTINLVAYRPLQSLVLQTSFAIDRNPLTTGLIPLYDGTVPYFWIMALGGSGQTIVAGHLAVAQA